MSPNRSITEEVCAIALEAGFDLGRIVAVPEPGSSDDYEELRHFEPWVDAGRGGEMDYLKRRDEAGRMLRSSLRIAIPWARSVVVCALNYNSAETRSIDPAERDMGWIARYAWSGQRDESGKLRPSDYHTVLLRRLQDVEARLRSYVNATEGSETVGEAGMESTIEFQSRCYVDTGPVVERVYAKYAGIGWIGKNTCILNQSLGSWLFLGVIVTSLDLADWRANSPGRGDKSEYQGEDQGEDQGVRDGPPGRPLTLPADRCGSCTRCLDACPTNALTAPYEMDASLCISYLTIEKRGEIAEPLRALMGRQVFGCDICQDVCPWNRKAPIGSDAKFEPREELVNPSLERLADLDEAGFGRIFNGSPVKRAKFSGLRRNVAIAMGNAGLRKFLPRLEAWTHSEDAVLRDAAAWACAQIESRGSVPDVDS